MPDPNKRDHLVPRHNAPPKTRVKSIDSPALTGLLSEWMQEDQAEHQETFEVLRHALDEGRPAGYKLFSQA